MNNFRSGMSYLSESTGSWPGLEFIVSYSSYLVSSPSEMVEGSGSIYKYGVSVDYPLVLPSNCLVELLITSEDVIHSWTVEGLGVKCDAIPGRINSAYINNMRPGYTAWGGCSEMCGVNHWQMSAQLEVLSQKDFYQWALCMVYLSMKEQ
nr:COX2 [Donax semistriatus]